MVSVLVSDTCAGDEFRDQSVLICLPLRAKGETDDFFLEKHGRTVI